MQIPLEVEFKGKKYKFRNTGISDDLKVLQITYEAE